VQSLLPLILFALVAAVFSRPAAAVDDRDRTGAGASTEGGASLGGTGIDSGVRNPRGGDDPDKRLRLERHPKPPAEPQLRRTVIPKKAVIGWPISTNFAKIASCLSPTRSVLATTLFAT